ncbi:MAG TPA: hypothetical protein DCS87_11500 [Rheinheimera sp.]|nr:hypothetical protein [Rheinheimera sp.]
MKKFIVCLSFLSAFNAASESLKLGNDLSDGVVFESEEEVLVLEKEIRFSVKAINKEMNSFDDFIAEMYESLPSWYIDGALNSNDFNYCVFEVGKKKHIDLYMADWYWHHHVEKNESIQNELNVVGIHRNLRSDFMMFSICQRIKDNEHASMAEYVKRYDNLLYVGLGVDIIP